jgi:hypothetical protein
VGKKLQKVLGGAQEVQVLLGLPGPAVKTHKPPFPVGLAVGKAQGAEVGELPLGKLASGPRQGLLPHPLRQGVGQGVGHPQVPGPGDGGKPLLPDLVDHLLGVGAVPHQVPQDQDLVHPFLPEGFQNGLQGREVGVDVGDDPKPHAPILPRPRQKGVKTEGQARMVEGCGPSFWASCWPSPSLPSPLGPWPPWS